MHDFFTTTAACGSAVFDGQPQDLTAGAEIYGGKGEIEESMTSTASIFLQRRTTAPDRWHWRDCRA
jgi:hypothetical protein